MASSTPDATSQTAASLIVLSIMNLESDMMLCFQANLDSVYNMMIVASMFGASWKKLIVSKLSVFSYWPIPLSGDMGCYLIHTSVSSCLH